jgi:hypothetical protein
MAPSLVVLLTGSAFAQSATSAGTPQPLGRGYIAGLAGATIDPGTTAAMSIEYGEDLRRNVQAYATFTYFDDLMTQALRNDLAAAAASLGARTGSPWEFTGRDRAAAFVVGGKYLFGGSAVRPYVGAGAGAINVKRTIVDRYRGNVATALANDLNVGDALLASAAVTGPLVEGIVGVELSGGGVYVDVGYRHRRAFRFTDPLNVGQVSVGVGYRF